MKRLILFIFCFCLLQANVAIAQNITWFRSYESPWTDVGKAIVQTPDNGYIVAGEGIIGLFAMRLNVYGDTIWLRVFPGGATRDIIKTMDNNYVVLGIRSEVTKFDINGNIIWTRGQFDPNIGVVSLKETEEGDFIIVGSKDTLGILARPYLLKLNANGNMIWGRSYNTNIYFGEFIHTNLAYDNNYLLTGDYSTNDSINDNLFFMKTDTAGEPIFFYGYDTIRGCFGNFIFQNNYNTFIIGGQYDGGPFLAKINSSGIIQWLNKYVYNGYNNCYGVTNTNDKGYALTGWWDTAGTGIEGYVYLIKTDSNGNEQFRKLYIYTPLEGNAGFDIKQTSDSGYIIAGVRANQNIDDIIVIKTDKNGYTQIIGIEPISSNIPKNFKLYQNYPNPFNPSTRIKFDLAVNSQVKIIIYDVLGREVKIIIDDNLKAGTYEINFNATNLSSGVYYYSLSVEDPSLNSGQGFRETKKMILIK